MLDVLVIIAVFVLALICMMTDKIYSQMGKNQEFTTKVPLKSQRALRYITDNKRATNALLTTISALLLGCFIVLVDRQIGAWAIAIGAMALIIVFWVAPESKNLGIMRRFSYVVAPYTRLCLEKLQPIAKHLRVLIGKVSDSGPDSGIYTAKDLVDFLRRQKHSSGNLIPDEELDNLVARMEFDNKKIKQIMRPRKKMKTIGASEAIGPVLINELHESGQRYFLVEEEFNNEIIGTLDVAELTSLKQTGNVKSAMKAKLYYVNEKHPLPDCINAFFVTGSDVFVVINSDEDIVGIINIDDVMTALMGHKKSDDFSSYDSIEAVAEARTKSKED